MAHKKKPKTSSEARRLVEGAFSPLALPDGITAERAFEILSEALRYEQETAGPKILVDLANMQDDAADKFGRKWAWFLRSLKLTKPLPEVLRETRDTLTFCWDYEVSIRPNRSVAKVSHETYIESKRAQSFKPDEFHSDGSMRMWLTKWVNGEVSGVGPTGVNFIVIPQARILKPAHFFALLAMCFLDSADRMGKCCNPGCPAPYFLKSRSDQKFCADGCSQYAQRQYAKNWWHRRKQEQTAKGDPPKTKNLKRSK